MGELTARALLAQGTGTLMVVNRTFERASEIAGELGGIAVPFDKLGRRCRWPTSSSAPPAATARSSAGPTCTTAMRERRGKPMFLIDLAVPRSFEPSINALDGVYLYDIDDLEGVIADNKGRPRRRSRDRRAHRRGRGRHVLQVARRPRRRADDGGAPREDRAHPRGRDRALPLGGGRVARRPPARGIERLTRRS
jgi:hypothetical protein